MTNREIDELVHHDVMGVARPPKGWSLANPIPHYSTDPAASKQLRDKMRADGWSGRISGYPSGKHFAAFWRGDEGGVKSRYADTEELATALAALRAKGVEVEGM